jgi:hypothetical protein
MNVQCITIDDFRRCYGSPDTSRAVHSFTNPTDTQIVLALLAHSKARRIIEIGTALGHMTANLTEWSPDDALICTMGTVADLPVPTAEPQRYENPSREAFGRFANHFGKVHKVLFITADSLSYDFHLLVPIDFAFIDGAHDEAHVKSDTLKIYRELSPSGCITWHDFNSLVPWVEVRKALERLDFAETVYHVIGTQVAFLDRQAPPMLGKSSGGASTVGMGAGCLPELLGEKQAMAPAKSRVSLCMIVRNEEPHLAACLASVADLVREIIVVDTGSIDRTKEVAVQFGAEIIDFAWIDDFGAARNEARLLQVLATRPGTRFTGADAGMHAYKARHVLAEIYRDQRGLIEAEAQWRIVLQERPQFVPVRALVSERVSCFELDDVFPHG